MFIGSRNGTWNKLKDLVKENELKLNLAMLFRRKVLLKQAKAAEIRKQIEYSRRIDSYKRDPSSQV